MIRDSQIFFYRRQKASCKSSLYNTSDVPFDRKHVIIVRGASIPFGRRVVKKIQRILDVPDYACIQLHPNTDWSIPIFKSNYFIIDANGLANRLDDIGRLIVNTQNSFSDHELPMYLIKDTSAMNHEGNGSVVFEPFPEINVFRSIYMNTFESSGIPVQHIDKFNIMMTGKEKK